MNLYPRLRWGWRTKSALFKSEVAFCDWVARALDKWGYRYEREKFCGATESRIDFSVNEAGVDIEAKVDVSWTCFDRAIGQIIRYQKLEQMRPWILVPDDVFLGNERVELAASIGSRIVRLSELEGQLEFSRVGYVDSMARYGPEDLAVHMVKRVLKKRRQLADNPLADLSPGCDVWEEGERERMRPKAQQIELQRRAA